MKSTLIILFYAIIFLFIACYTDHEIYSIDNIEKKLIIRKWLICGPFPGDVDLSQYQRITKTDTTVVEDFLDSIGGERQAFPAAGTVVKFPELKLKRWWTLQTQSTPGLNLNSILDVKKGDFVYVFSHLKSNKVRQAELTVHFMGKLKLILNGKIIFNNEAYTDSGITSITLPVEFQKDSNQLLLKMTRIAEDFNVKVKIGITG